MSSPTGIERRDPASGLMKLCQVLTEARLGRQSGWVLVRDQGCHFIIQLKMGFISNVYDDGESPVSGPNNQRFIEQCLDRIFGLKRPHVQFEPQDMLKRYHHKLDSRRVIIRGVRTRSDLFDPLTLAGRIPVCAISLSRDTRDSLRGLIWSSKERVFLDSLRVPTPVPMALWKRGLPPKEAGILVMALNLLGGFENWRPGDLPQGTAASELRRKSEVTKNDYALLGLDEGASIEEVDRAFRKLSFSLHPDRAAALGKLEAARAKEAFQQITAAHARVKNSRRTKRRRPSGYATVEVTTVRNAGAPWMPLLDEARLAAATGDGFRAKRLAIKAMALTPPPSVVSALKQLIRSVA